MRAMLLEEINAVTGAVIGAPAGSPLASCGDITVKFSKDGPSLEGKLSDFADCLGFGSNNENDSGLNFQGAVEGAHNFGAPDISHGWTVG
jgi:hypothetical protein